VRRCIPRTITRAASAAEISLLRRLGMVERKRKKAGCSAPSVTSGVRTQPAYAKPTATPCAANSMRHAFPMASIADLLAA